MPSTVSAMGAIVAAGRRALPRDELLLGLARRPPAAALAEPLADELEVAVDLLRVVAAADAPERALDHEHRARVAAGGHPSGVRRGPRESSARNGYAMP